MALPDRRQDNDAEGGALAPSTIESLDAILASDPGGAQRIELAILRLDCLFHRPASRTALDALLAAPAIDGLTAGIPEHVIQPPPGFLSRILAFKPAAPAVDPDAAEVDWNAAVERLRRAGLLLPESEGNPGGVNAPAAVRERVGDDLRRRDLAAWQAGHLRLFKYYDGLVANRLPSTLTEMEPLYAAIVHGCAGGAHQEAFDRVYVDRMLQRHSLYLGKMLGAYDAWLEVLAKFFDEPWTKPTSELSPESRRTALAQAGFALRGAGRLREAIAPIRLAIEASIELENWMAASAEAQNLSEILSTLGDLQESLIIARDGVRFSERTQDFLRRLSARARLGDALHQYGEIRLAARNFRRAERWQRKAREDLPLLVSMRHYNYSDLLLAMGRHDEVRVRGLWALDVSREFQGLGMGPLDIALDKLTIARAAHAQWREQQGMPSIPIMPPSKDEDGDPDASPGEEDKTQEDTLPSSVPSVRSIKYEAIEDNRNNTDHHDCAQRAFDQAVEEMREERHFQYLPAALVARSAFRRDNQDFAGALADLDEAAAIAGAGEMRLFQADIALERIRLALAEDHRLASAEVRERVNALWLEARDLIQACCYHRRAPELETLKEALKALPAL
ncbi:MAG: hypothetical protein RLZ98_1796 [Pseudomonadota bacterium]|jgi:tetratricopeptide (TPR) repeat protein